LFGVWRLVLDDQTEGNSIKYRAFSFMQSPQRCKDAKGEYIQPFERIELIEPYKSLVYSEKQNVNEEKSQNSIFALAIIFTLTF
jgi:hypothetical protein